MLGTFKTSGNATKDSPTDPLRSRLRFLLADLLLYRRLVGMQIRAQLQYKANVAIDIGTYFFVTALEFCTIFIYFSAFPTMLGWRVGEVALLYSVMSFGFGLAEMVGAGIDNFSETIRRGEFDRLLLRPIGAFTQVIGSDFRLRRLGRLSQGTLGMVLAMHLLPGFSWSLSKLLALALGVVSGGVLFTMVMLLGATLCFWTVETTEMINIFTYGARDLLSYPLGVYSQALQCVFLFVVPLAFGTFVPVSYLLGRPLPFGLPPEIAFASPLVASAFALIAGIAWRFGIRRYQSTGS
jgi:ABC-2 type transport system permease protein